jgi:hypothetical protein
MLLPQVAAVEVLARRLTAREAEAIAPVPGVGVAGARLVESAGQREAAAAAAQPQVVVEGRAPVEVAVARLSGPAVGRLAVVVVVPRPVVAVRVLAEVGDRPTVRGRASDRLARLLGARSAEPRTSKRWRGFVLRVARDLPPAMVR